MLNEFRTQTLKHRPLALAGSLALLGLLAATAPASAQGRDPAYAAARAAGKVGEAVDGYLDFPAPPTADIKRMAEDINIKRKAVYAERAQANNVTIEEYAYSQGCVLIARTVPGEKYQAPDGSWRTRDAGAPLRDARCP